MEENTSEHLHLEEEGEEDDYEEEDEYEEGEGNDSINVVEGNDSEWSQGADIKIEEKGIIDDEEQGKEKANEDNIVVQSEVEV